MLFRSQYDQNYKVAQVLLHLPLKQGLKLNPKISFQEAANIVLLHLPLKQGLKQTIRCWH